MDLPAAPIPFLPVFPPSFRIPSCPPRRRAYSTPPSFRSEARRNACLQEHFDDAAHEPQRGEVSGQGRAPLPRHSEAKRGIPTLSFTCEGIPPLRWVPLSG